MATHFARWTPTPYLSPSLRLSDETLNIASRMPVHRRMRYLASRTLLAELIFMLYGVARLPKIVTSTSGRPHFINHTLIDFSIAYAGNMVGVLATTEGRCGLDMEIQSSFGSVTTPSSSFTSSHEIIWINNQTNPNEARSQLHTLRQGVMKLTGNAKGNANALQLQPASGRLRVTNEPRIEAISDAEDILVWSCIVAPGMEQLKLWEYVGQQHWRELPDINTRRHSLKGRMIRLTNMPPEKMTSHRDVSRTF